MAIVKIPASSAPTGEIVLKHNEWYQPTGGGTIAEMAIAESSTSDGLCVDIDPDHKSLIIATNAHATDAKKVTVKAGNGIQGTNDIAEESIAAGDVAFIVLESGSFKNVEGDYKGGVKILGESTDVKILVVKLP